MMEVPYPAKPQQAGTNADIDEYLFYIGNLASGEPLFTIGESVDEIDRRDGIRLSSLLKFNPDSWDIDGDLVDSLWNPRTDAANPPDDPYAVPEDAEPAEIPDDDDTIEDWGNSSTPAYTGILDAKDENLTLEASIAAAVLLGEWLFRPRTGQYLAPTTKGKPRQAIALQDVVEPLESRIETAKRRFNRLNARYLTDRVGIDEWFTQAEQEVLRIHTEAFILGRGGVDQMQKGDREALQKILTFQRHRLSDFHSELMQELVSEGKLLARLRQYAESANQTFKAGVHQWAISSGKTQAMRSLSPDVREHCPECPGYATDGWVGIGAIVLPGTACSCGANCKCSVAYR